MNYAMLTLNILAAFISVTNAVKVIRGEYVSTASIVFAFIALGIFFALNTITALERIKKEKSK